MNVEQRLLDAGYEDVIYFTNPSYDSAFIGVSSDYRAIYDYELMIRYLMSEEGMTDEEAIDWIDYNTIRALPYMENDGNAPVIMYGVDWLGI